MKQMNRAGKPVPSSHFRHQKRICLLYRIVIHFTLLFILALFLPDLIITPVTAAQSDKSINVLHASGKQKVLVLHSYHNMDWTRAIQEGIESVFDKSGIAVEMYVEYMDTMRHSPKDSFAYLEDLYRKKYSHISFAVILLSDDNALEFLLSRRDKLFPKVPIVFCGINDFREERLHGQSGITGVNEDIDIKGTIELASRIMPNIKKFLVISDRTSTGLAIRKKFEQTLSGFSNQVPAFELLDDLTTADLQKHLGKLTPDSAVLLFTFQRDKDGRLFTRPEYYKLIVGSCNVPVFTFWEQESLRHGVMGGVMVSGMTQGERSAEYALRILKGEPASSLPFIMKSPNVPILDYRLLRRFNIPEEVVPPEVIIRNKPITFYYRYKTAIWLICSIFTFIAFVNILLLINIARRKRAEEALRESEAKFRAIFEQAAVGVTEIDINTGRFLTVNRRLCEIVSRTKEELLDTTFLEITHPQDLELHKDKSQIILTGEIDHYSLEKRYLRKDGGIVWVNITVSPLRKPGEKPVRNIVVVEDISDRKRIAEEERRSREAAERLAGEIAVVAEIGRVIGSTLNIDDVYERVATEALKLIPFDSMMVNLIRVDEKALSITYVSGIDIPARRKGDRIPFEGSLAEAVICGKKGMLLQSESVEEILKKYPPLAHVVKAGLISTISVPLISTDNVIGVLVFRSKIRDAYTEQDLRLAEKIGMQISGAIANAQLFNDLNKTEKSLRESERKYRSLAAASDSMYLVDRDCRFLLVNARHLARFGLPAEQVIGRKHGEFHSAEEAVLFQNQIKRVIETGESLQDEYRSTRDGRYFVRTLSPIRDDNGMTSSVTVVAKDITDRKKAEEEKRSLEDRLFQSHKMEALGQMAGGVAHDLNNILGILSGYSELLLLEIPEGSRSRAHAEKILRSTEKGAAIIEDLLTLARRGVTAADVINLNGVVSEFLKSPVLEKLKDYHPRVTFRTESDPNLLNIKGSPVHLEKTLMNLVSNAAEAISGEGEVTIRTESRYLDKPLRGYDEVKEGDYAVLTVSDTGMGIPAENRAKIFEPFYTKKTMGRSGTGLGLAIVWGTVKDHNGYIDVQTEVGEGTTFTLYFPVTREEVVAQRQKMPIAQYMGNGESVLVVDDIAEQRDVAAGLLTRLGYQVHVVPGGEAAVEYLKGNKADILVLDMIMAPGMDGLETYQRILEIHPKQKAILVSGFSETDRVRAAQKLGAGTYVKKPYVMEKIGVAIWNELDRK